MKAHLITAVSAVMFVASVAAHAAEVTTIAQPTDEDRAVGFQFNLGYGLTRDTGQIAREQSCLPGRDLDPDGRSRCSQPMTVLNREMEYERNNHFLDLDFRLALPKRTELRIVLPIGLSDQANYAFADDVNTGNSTISPSMERVRGALADAQPFFDTYRFWDTSEGWQPPKRSGLGDLQLHFNWLAMSQDTHPERANLLLGVAYTAPTGAVRQGGNSAYGDGVHWLNFRLAASRQIQFIEPYFQFSYSAPVGGSRGVFPALNKNESFVTPGHKIDFVAGTDFELYKAPETGAMVRVGVGASLGLQTAGRDRSPIFEGLSHSECNGVALADTNTPTNGTGYEPIPTSTTAQCGWVTQQPGAAQDGNWATGTFSHDGITTVESKMYIGAHARLVAHFQRNVGLQLTASWLAYTNHVLTSENTGEDLDGDGSVSMEFDSAERNPNYNPTMDAPGRRFIFEGFRQLHVGADLFVRF